MPTIELKVHGDFFGEHDPKYVHLTEVRSFRTDDGRSYLVYRYPKSKNKKKFSYHVFLEVEDVDAYKQFCNGKKSKPKQTQAKPGWWDVWPESES